METETNNWLKEEVKNYSSDFSGEKKPALKLEENKVTTLSIPTAQPFEKWEDRENNTVKKIIPCMVNGQEFVWWLNCKNPVYTQILQKSVEVYPEPLVINVLQTGSKQNTRYTIVAN